MAHRDVKPENVLCVDKDAASPIKLGDFDLSSKESTLTTTPRLQTPVGSLEYMAPEVSQVHLEDEEPIPPNTTTFEGASCVSAYIKALCRFVLSLFLQIFL